MAFQAPVAILYSPFLPTFLSGIDSPPILTVLQAHSRLKNVQTLSTGLQPIVHNAFSLRFVEFEESTRHETLVTKEHWVAWVAQRIKDASNRSDWKADEDGESAVWLEAQRCLESTAGDENVIAVLLMASTDDPSPLIALQALHARVKSFADAKSLLVFFLVVTKSPADPTLLPSLQRTFGPHCAVLSLPAPLATDGQIAVPAALPRPPPLQPHPETPALPRTTPTSPTSGVTDDAEKPLPVPVEEVNGPKTITSSVSQAWHRFLRELVTQSLVPFMERSVLALHESYTTRRALPNRLLSITSRRFFGSSSAPASTSTSPKPTLATTSTSLLGTPAGDRRLVEWSAMLGDQKEVQAIGDPIRREARGANIEDLLLLHALHNPPPPPPAAQAVPSLTPLAAACLRPPMPMTAASSLSRALVLSRADYMLNVHSRNGIAGMSPVRRNEVARWFALAAGDVESPLSAMLLARAGVWETGRRRKALWYAIAGLAMEGHGLDQLTLLFLRRAYEAFSQTPALKVGELGELEINVTRWFQKDKIGHEGFPIPESITSGLRLLGYPLAEEKLIDYDDPPDTAESDNVPKRRFTLHSQNEEALKEKEAAEAASAIIASWRPVKEGDPLVVEVNVDEGLEVEHDFGQLGAAFRPCRLNVTFTIRNVSPSRATQFTLRLPSAMAAVASAQPPLIPPQWIGTLVHNGILPPLGACEKRARLSLFRAGNYALAGWRLYERVDGDEFFQLGREGVVRVVQR